MAGPSTFRVAALATLCVTALYLAASQSAPLRRLEGQLLDLRFQLRPATPPAAPIALVLVDDASIEAVGRWPWSRARLAELVGRLTQAGAAVIALDLLLAEPEREAVAADTLEAVAAALRAGDAARTRAMLARWAEGTGGDRRLAAAMRGAGNVVVPFSFGFAPRTAETGPAPAAVAEAAYRAYRVPDPGVEPAVPLIASAVLAPVPAIAEAAAGLGHANIALDADGAARFEYPVVAYGGRYYPSFAIEVARLALGVPRGRVRVEFGRGVDLGGRRFVPTGETMRLPVNYRRPGRHPAYPAADVLAGRTDPAAFAGRVVLVGGSAAGIGETFLTPFSPVLPGTARHAAVVEGVLAGDHVLRRDATALADLAVLAVAGLALGAVAARRGMVATGAAFLALLAATVAGNLALFVGAGLWLNLVFPVLGLVAVFGAVTLHKYVAGQRRQRAVRHAFEHYLHPAVVDELCRDPGLLRPGGEERELTVLFADIRGFTAIAERLPPPDLVRLVNAYYTAMTRAIVDARGMLDQYVGDGLMAVFGAPLPLDDHALRACRAALAMRRELEALNRRSAAAGLPEIRIGIGINTGRMVLGNLGSEQRVNYTVLGDGVNLAARLEAANKDYGTCILVSEATWRQAEGGIAGRELDVVRVKGKEQPVRVFEILGLPPLPEPERRRADAFAAALAAYREGRWRDALAGFEGVLALDPGDDPSRLYARRCRERLAAKRRAG